MIGRDYIMRMIQQLAAVIAKVLFRIEQKQFPEAFREIDDGCQSLIGTKWDFLRSLSDGQMIQLFGALEHPDRLLAASEFLRQASRVFALQGDADESFRQGLKAFSLFTELLMVHPQYADLPSAADFAALLEQLEQFELPAHLELKRFRFYEITGHLLRAGEVLQEIVRDHPNMRTEGVAFCRRLEKLTDAKLASAGLDRERIKDWRRLWEGPLVG
jgi:hypothetical protein